MAAESDVLYQDFFYDSFLVQESLFVIFVGWVLSKNVIRRHLIEKKGWI